jgi:ubiquinol-cytochrome c reductase cytochrome b subunit
MLEIGDHLQRDRRPLGELMVCGDGKHPGVGQQDRPREAAVRTALGAAGMTFFGLLWVAAANDQIAHQFDLSLFAVTWFFRIAVLAGPLMAFEVTRRLCLALQAQEREERAHGIETGIIHRSPHGGYTETIAAPPAQGRIPANRP